jgi:hypothetical protein
MSDLIERLRQIGPDGSGYQEIAREAATEIESLRAALRPFAEFAHKAEQFVDSRAKSGGSPIMPTKDFRLADFERAKAALAL